MLKISIHPTRDTYTVTRSVVLEADGMHSLVLCHVKHRSRLLSQETINLDFFRTGSAELGCNVSGPQFPHLKNGTSLTWLWQGYITTQIATCYYSLQLQLFILFNYLPYLFEFSFLPHL